MSQPDPNPDIAGDHRKPAPSLQRTLAGALARGLATVCYTTRGDTTPADPAKQILLKDVGQKWGKFSPQELTDLKNNDDLVTQVVAKYGVEKMAAQRDVDSILKGRTI